MTDSENERGPEHGASVPVDPVSGGTQAGGGMQASGTQTGSGMPAEDRERAIDESVTKQTVRIKRTPRYARFILVAVIVCAAVAFILTYSFPQGAGYDRVAVFGYLLLVAIALGIVLGSLAALLADRVNARRAAMVVADRVDVKIHPIADVAQPVSSEPPTSPEVPTGSTDDRPAA